MQRDQIILNASHTHSGPVIGDSLIHIYPLDKAEEEKIYAYEKHLIEAVVKTVAQAFDTLAPATLEAGNGHVRFAVNRRNNTESAILDTHDFNGPVDHAAPVLRIKAADGATRVILFGYACHATHPQRLCLVRRLPRLCPTGRGSRQSRGDRHVLCRLRR